MKNLGHVVVALLAVERSGMEQLLSGSTTYREGRTRVVIDAIVSTKTLGNATFSKKYPCCTAQVRKIEGGDNSESSEMENLKSLERLYSEKWEPAYLERNG